MSIPVDLDQLATALSDFPYGYLLTTSGAAVKAIAITAHVEDAEVVIPVESRGSSTNLASNPTATLLFPPTEPRGYSLIVDGTARADGEGFRLAPSRAVLHRPAAHSDEGEGTHTHDGSCGHDCKPL